MERLPLGNVDVGLGAGQLVDRLLQSRTKDVARESRGVAQQMLDLDLLRALRIRKIREELRQGIVVTELPLLDELTDSEAGEQLVDAAEEKRRLDG